MKTDLAIALLRLGSKLPAFVLRVADKVGDSISDGQITPDEAEALARDASAEAGDLLRVKVKGVDVVDDDAQADLAAFVGRVTSSAVRALRG